VLIVWDRPSSIARKPGNTARRIEAAIAVRETNPWRYPMTRKQLKSGKIVPRRKAVAYWAIATTLLVVIATVQWLVITRSNPEGKTEFFSDLPDVDLSILQASARDDLVRQANLQKCPCNCGLTLACCRNRDRSCQTSLKIARDMVKQASKEGP
jgi:hypothetical protein